MQTRHHPVPTRPSPTGRRRRPPLLRTALFLVAALAAAACGGGNDDGASDGSARPGEGDGGPTTAAPAPAYPLTGLPVTNAGIAARPALVVKIDNADNGARPQSGLNQADVVYEEMVEGGVTRLAALFHSGDSDPVGPVRSARLTDIDVFGPLNVPLYAYSGGNAGVTEAIGASPQHDVGFSFFPDAYFRSSGYRAPHNQFSTTPALFALAPPGVVPPPALFQYRAPGDNSLPANPAPIGVVRLDFGGPVSPPIDWAWDASTNTFIRAQNGSPHVDTAGVQVNPQNVVIQFTEYFFNGDTDSGGNPVPQAQMVGGGDCWVLTNGAIVQQCRWTKASTVGVIQYTDATGAPIKLTPGRTWVELLPPGGATITAGR